MLEKLAEYFYDPLVFWTTPLVLVALVIIFEYLDHAPFRKSQISNCSGLTALKSREYTAGYDTR